MSPFRFGKRSGRSTQTGRMSITHDAILSWRSLGPHTGLRTKHMPVFDIDILDGEAAAVVENIVRDFLANGRNPDPHPDGTEGPSTTD